MIGKQAEVYLTEKQILKSSAEKALEKAKALEAKRIAEGWVNKRFPDRTIRLVRP